MLPCRPHTVLLLAIIGITILGAGPERPVDVFAELNGTWTGVFVGYNTAGRELYRIRVRQTYQTLDDTTQSVHIEDTMPDGTVITGEGRNIARTGPDGAPRLECVVEKSTGDRVEHRGRLGRGIYGRPQIIWHTNRPGRIETFRESVRREGERTVYEINGLGRYGDTLVLMHGRYVKAEGVDAKKSD